MPANNSAGSASEPGREASAQKGHFPRCEHLMHELAIKPRVSVAIAIRAHLCASCSQKLTELLTTIGLGVKNDHATQNLPDEGS
jgi:hypothetical protein